MVITDIAPCMKVTKENDMSGIDMYIEIGDHIKITDDKSNIFIGKLSFIEWSKYEEEDDMIHLVLDDDNVIRGVSYIEDIEVL
ncbi:MAG: hypothetical protein K0R54_4370 [Clostridiaceae bacterium]|jgi:hypothetical protein|nr:hypothetical protein [Clostridiaceae bacterium]